MMPLGGNMSMPAWGEEYEHGNTHIPQPPCPGYSIVCDKVTAGHDRVIRPHGLIRQLGVFEVSLIVSNHVSLIKVTP